MPIKYSLKKGHVFERQIAKELTRILGVSFRRVPMSGAIHNFLEGDIMKMDNKLTIIDNTILECKDCKTIKMPQWIKQVEEEAKRADTKKWILFFKFNGIARAVLNLDHLEHFLKLKLPKTVQTSLRTQARA